jgi:stearoyl-CoA desaturase (delta-9 desaturase)
MSLFIDPLAGESVIRAERPWRLGAPFVIAHLALIGIFFAGWSTLAIVVAALSYSVRAFGITAFYHRCFSHRAFKVSRAVQLAGALAGAAAAQRGPLWWVAHHREHHRFTDQPGDPHSPVIDTFWYSHVMWIFEPENAATRLDIVPDLAVFPELRLIDRFEHLVPGVFAAGMFLAGVGLARLDPALHTSGWQLLEWGFFLPTIVLYHSTFAVNSFAHRFGRRRFPTPDASRNNLVVALLVFGEGWHNNHHRFPTSARQGIGWYEFDPTWWGIRVLQALHLARGIRGLPPLPMREVGADLPA